MLKESAAAVPVPGAFAAAHQGDYSGLALLSWRYDNHLRKELKQRHGPYHGEFSSKMMSSGLDVERDWIKETEPEGAIIGSLAAKLLWGAASGGGWPIDVVEKDFSRDAAVDVETPVLMGHLDINAPVEYVREELMPHLKKGRLVVLSDMGHGDLVKRQPEAYAHLAARFFFEGVADAATFTH